VVVTAPPAIHRRLGGSLGPLEWPVNSYGLTFSMAIPTVTAVALGAVEAVGTGRASGVVNTQAAAGTGRGLP
jgi:hypothetical protein